MMSYQTENDAKAQFDSVYTAPTPHAYIEAMARTGYEIGEQARPYCTAAAELVRERNGDAWPVQMLDVGCSYGMASAFVKYGCSFDEMVAFFSTRAPSEYRAVCEATRMWLNVVPPACDLRCVGLDSSEPAINFGLDSGLLDGGVARNYEIQGASPTEEERAWFRSCNLMICTGAIGYVSERTLDIVLRDLGGDHPGEFGPCALFTILRMFDSEPIEAVFERHGFNMIAVPETTLRQRKFTDSSERNKVIKLLHERGVDTSEWEDRGKLFADLYIAAPPQYCSALLEKIVAAQSELENEPLLAGYIRR